MDSLSPSAVIAADGQEIKQHGSHEFPCGFYHLSHSPHVPWHWHEEFECTCVEKGCVYYNTPQGRFLLKEGDGIFLNSGTLHSAEAVLQEDCRKSDLVFHGRLVYGSTDSILYKKYIRPFQEPDAWQVLVLRNNVPWHREILQRIRKASRLCQNRPEGYEFTVRNLLSESLFDISCYYLAPASESSAGTPSENQRVKDMLLYLQENFSRPVTIAQLAEHTSICQRECLRCFRKILRITPIQYLIRYRISRACILLRDTDLSILEISSKCGFESPSYFTKTFRKTVGLTPTQYRKAPHKD